MNGWQSKPVVGKTTEGGWGAAHKAEKKRWQASLNAGAIITCACAHRDCPHHEPTGCTTQITAGTAWDLGHSDDRTTWVGPECIRCNRSAGARNSNRRTTIREWV